MKIDSAFPSATWIAGICVSHRLVEGSHHGRVDYRVDGKIVVNVEDDGQITIKLPVSEQQALRNEYPDAISLPGGWAKHGWTTIRIGALGPDLVTELVLTAIDTVTGKPKRSID